MSRRIDIELTSARPDGTWTWRAAGAMQPRGVLDGSILYEGAKAGDVVRADAEFEIDGITVTSVSPPKQKRPEPERLELIGPSRPPPGVTTTLARPSRGPAGRADRGDRGDRKERGDRGERGGPRPSRREGAERRPDRAEQRGRRGGRPEQQEEATSPAPDGRSRRAPQHPGPRERTPRREHERERGEPARSAPASERGRRLSPGNAHRTAVLDALAPEQRPIAEQVLRGGIPAVRPALHPAREKAAAEGRPAPNAEALLSMAEDLLPRLKAAEWRDRAEAAAKAGDDISLRDLRSVVAGADTARDEESRQLAATLRETLERRIDSQRREWLSLIDTSVDEGRVVRALRLSARPPDPGARFPAELATRLAEAAGAAMAPDTAADRWAAVLEAVLVSPVRRSVKPAGLPAEPGDELLHAARQASGRVPALAAMLGVKIPPPPGPPRGSGAPAHGRPPPPVPERREPHQDRTEGAADQAGVEHPPAVRPEAEEA